MPTYIISYTQGNSSGPFDVYLSGSSGLNLYASNVQQYQLANGYTVTFPDGIPSSSIEVFDVSYGCFTTQNVPLPTTSPSVTPSITITPSKTPSITVSPSKTPSISPSLTSTPSTTPPSSPTPTPTVTPSSSPPSTSPTPTPTPSVTRTPSASPPINYSDLFYIMTPGANTAQLACYGIANGLNNTITNIYIQTPAGVPVPQPLALNTVVYITISNFPNVYAPFDGNNIWYYIDSYISQNMGDSGYFYRVDDWGVIQQVSFQTCPQQGG
jgi:hypothetical protein